MTAPIQVFYSDKADHTPDSGFWDEVEEAPIDSGWFYWYCFGGCMPEGDPIGPFATEAEARAEADDEEAEQVASSGPQPEDFTLSDCGPLLSQTSVDIVEGKSIGVYSCHSEALAAVRRRMESDGFYPNIWKIDDHGGETLIDIEGNQV